MTSVTTLRQGCPRLHPISWPAAEVRLPKSIASQCLRGESSTVWGGTRPPSFPRQETLRMRKQILSVALAASASLGLVTTAVTAASAAPSPSSAAAGAHANRVCATPSSPTVAACHALKLVDAAGPCSQPRRPTGHPQRDLRQVSRPTSRVPTRSAGLSAGGRTVAIVDAYGYPNAERDLGVYRAQCGPVLLHHGQRLPAHPQPERRHVPAHASTSAGPANRPSTSTPSPRPAPAARSSLVQANSRQPSPTWVRP